MKKIIIGLFVIIGLTTTVNAQQISLYDSEGEARAYIDYDEEATIFNVSSMKYNSLKIW